MKDKLLISSCCNRFPKSGCFVNGRFLYLKEVNSGRRGQRLCGMGPHSFRDFAIGSSGGNDIGALGSDDLAGLVLVERSIKSKRNILTV
jgi:hypothetical protein